MLTLRMVDRSRWKKSSQGVNGPCSLRNYSSRVSERTQARAQSFNLARDKEEGHDLAR